MKSEYLKPEIEISLFATEAVICVSGTGTGTGTGTGNNQPSTISDNLDDTNTPATAFNFSNL